MIYPLIIEKLRQKDISKNVTAAARLAADNLPSFLEECAVVYLPEMGHLISIKEWEEDCNPEALDYLGFKFVVSTVNYFQVSFDNFLNFSLV